MLLAPEKDDTESMVNGAQALKAFTYQWHQSFSLTFYWPKLVIWPHWTPTGQESKIYNMSGRKTENILWTTMMNSTDCPPSQQIFDTPSHIKKYNYPSLNETPQKSHLLLAPSWRSRLSEWFLVISSSGWDAWKPLYQTQMWLQVIWIYTNRENYLSPP